MALFFDVGKGGLTNLANGLRINFYLTAGIIPVQKTALAKRRTAIIFNLPLNAWKTYALNPTFASNYKS